MRDLPKAKGGDIGGRKSKAGVRKTPANKPKTLDDHGARARKTRQPSQPVAPIPTRVGGRCTAPRWASGLARAV